MINFLSLCSGIEAFSCAVHDLPAYRPVAFAEIEPFPCAVLEHHYPDVPNLGDITQIASEELYGKIDLIVGGTPCQDFSVAGTRKGLAGERSALALHYARLVRDINPTWLLWENVPGCLSTNGGRDFATFVQTLAEYGYGLAWRILDAQFFGVPQRRRRVYLVGHLGNPAPACKVLFEPEGMRGNPPQGRKKGKDTSSPIKAGAGECGKRVVNTLTSRMQGSSGWAPYNETEHLIPTGYRLQSFGEYADDGTASALKSRDYKDATDLVCAGIAPAMTSSGPPYSRTGNQRVEADALVYHNDQALFHKFRGCDVYNGLDTGDIAATLTSAQNVKNASGPAIIQGSSSVRRLTPLECERLQGFPDNYTNIMFKGRPAADTPRYKALGNSMAVPVIRWIANRLAEVNRRLYAHSKDSR